MWMYILIPTGITLAINIAVLAYGYGKLCDRIENLEREMISYREKTDSNTKEIAELKGAFNMFKESQFLRKGSPITLTEAGEKMLEESGGKKFLEDNFDMLESQFKDIDNGYDIQEKAKEIIKDMEHKKEMDTIKTYLFNSGNTFNDVAAVMGTVLRDMILRKKDMLASHTVADKR